MTVRECARLLLATLIATSLLGCETTCRRAGQQFKYWTGQSTYLATVYPNRADLTVSQEIGWFKTLEECRTSCLQHLNVIGRPYPEVGDYECGLNCDSSSEWPGFWICQETLH